MHEALCRYGCNKAAVLRPTAPLGLLGGVWYSEQASCNNVELGMGSKPGSKAGKAHGSLAHAELHTARLLLLAKPAHHCRWQICIMWWCCWVPPVCNYSEMFVLPWGFSTWGVHPIALPLPDLYCPHCCGGAALEPGLSEDIF